MGALEYRYFTLPLVLRKRRSSVPKGVRLVELEQAAGSSPDMEQASVVVAKDHPSRLMRNELVQQLQHIRMNKCSQVCI